jgi:hypothetical protein
VAVAGCAEALITGNLVHYPRDRVLTGVGIHAPAEYLTSFRGRDFAV